jgi:hypothetical protein
MNRVNVINHNKKNIINIDLSNATVDETLTILKEASTVISRQNAKSARILTDVRDAIYTRQVSEAIKSFTANNTPYVHSSAVTGIDGIRSVLLQAVILLTRREIKVFSNREDALDYLAG